jgi:hypothetical protein
MLTSKKKKIVLKSVIKILQSDSDIDFDDIIQEYEDIVLFLKEVRITVLLHMSELTPRDS